MNLPVNRFIALLLCLLSLLHLSPAAAQEPVTRPTSMEHIAPLSGATDHAENTEQSPSLSEALFAVVAGPETHKGSKLLSWLRHHVEKLLHVSRG
jgi:hypothetical protein